MIQVLLCAVLAGFITWILYFIRNDISLPAKRRKNKLPLPKNQVTATLDRCIYNPEGESGLSMRRCTGKYSYEVDGVAYTYTLNSNYPSPKELVLYYDRDPKKACIPEEVGKSKNSTVKTYIVSFIILYILTAGFFR